MFLTSSTFVMKNKNDAKIEKNCFLCVSLNLMSNGRLAPFISLLPTILKGNNVKSVAFIRLVRTAFSACAVLLLTLNE